MNSANFSTSRLLVVGDVMLDKYIEGSVRRISPEAPVPIVRVEEEDARVGGAGNVALNAATLGAETHLLSFIGSDSTGDQIERMLREQNVQCQLQRIRDFRSTVKLRIMSRNQQLIRLDFEEPLIAVDGGAFLSCFERLLGQIDVVVLSDYAKGVLREPQKLIQSARSAKKPVIVDPKGSDFSRYRGASLITPNLDEFEAVVGYCRSDKEIEKRGLALCESIEVDAILITRSEKGMTLLEQNRQPIHLPTRAREIFDVTGAGDTVVATLGAAIAAGVPLPDAIKLANTSAGIAVTKLGTSTVTPYELQLALHHDAGETSNKILNEQSLKQKLSAARASGERIVMTNGCFDILHSGHVDYLQKARFLGHRLVVGVNDDASVRRLKGVGRPVNSLADRMHLLAALDSVDWVVPFTEDTPKRLYCDLLPDVLVKGGDYTEEEVVGGDCVIAAGGVVKIIEFREGFSTTEIIRRIRKAGD